MQIEFEQLEGLLANKTYIISADEVGTGALAYSLCVCGVKVSKDWKIPGLNDSKKLSPKKREILRQQLLTLADEKVIEFYISERTNIQIDQMGLGVALKDAYVEIFNKLYTKNSLLLCDGNLKFEGFENQVSLIKADTLVPSCMAASILAKTYRDEKIKKLHNLYPKYNFIKNVGYGSSEHIEAIKKYGLSPIHRKSYNIKGLKDK